MLKNSKAVALICGAVSMAATVIFYLLAFDTVFTIPMRWVSLMFLIFAEGIGTAKALSIEKSIFGVAGIITSLFHLGIVLAVSIIFVNAYPMFIKKYILLNILALCVLLAVDAVIVCFAEYKDIKNKSLAQNQAVADELYTIAKGLTITYRESGYEKDLNEISEMLMYSDNTVLSADDVMISDKLAELERLLADADERVPQKISDIKNAVKLRALKIKSNKRGNY